MDIYPFIPMLVSVAGMMGLALLAEWVTERHRRHRPRRSH